MPSSRRYAIRRSVDVGAQLIAYASAPEARAGIGRYVGFYNAVRPHSALGGRTPDQIYFDQPLLAAA